MVRDMATQGGKVHGLLSWRDPSAKRLFVGLCLVGVVVLYVVPFRVMVMAAGLYKMRHPRFRRRMLSEQYLYNPITTMYINIIDNMSISAPVT